MQRLYHENRGFEVPSDKPVFSDDKHVQNFVPTRGTVGVFPFSALMALSHTSLDNPACQGLCEYAVCV